MGQIPISKFSAADIPEAPEWIDPLLAKLNQQSQQLAGSLRSLTFTENSVAQLIENIRFTVPEPVWIAPTLLNSWVNFDTIRNPAGYRIEPGGRVWLRGLVRSGTAVAGTVIFTLPAGYLPPFEEMPPLRNANGALGEARVAANGNVTIQSGSNAYFSLDNITFLATSPAARPAAFVGEGWPIKVFHQLPAKPKIVIPLEVFEEDLAEGFSAGSPGFDFDHVGANAIRIRAAHGLTPGRKYKLSLLVATR